MNPNPCTCILAGTDTDGTQDYSISEDCPVHGVVTIEPTPDKATDSMYDRFNGGVDTEALLGNPPGIPVHPFEREAFLAETDKLISEINTINQRMAGIPRAYPRHPHSARLNAYKKLYDDRKAKVMRIQEINKICIEKGYIQA